MLTLYLLRHAKSSWADPGLRDFDRPLNKRGKRDAPFMGDVFKKIGLRADLIVSSPAKRAFVTASTIAERIGYKKEKILKNEDIYHADARSLVKIVNELPVSKQKVMLVGHNPTFTDTVNYLTDFDLDNLPTCALVGIEFPFDEWRAVSERNGKVVLHEYPKKYQ